MEHLTLDSYIKDIQRQVNQELMQHCIVAMRDLTLWCIFAASFGWQLFFFQLEVCMFFFSMSLGMDHQKHMMTAFAKSPFARSLQMIQLYA